MVEQKKFLKLELPIIEQKIELLAANEEELAGRTVKMDLTRKLRGKSLEAIFKIKVSDKKIRAELYRLHLLSYFITRIMRKSVNYVEDSFSSECKNAVLKIKPFLITRKKVSRVIRKALRNKAKEEIQAEIKDKSYEDIFSDILSGKFQKFLSLKLKKIYPLAFCEIRDIFVEQEKENIVVEEKIE